MSRSPRWWHFEGHLVLSSLLESVARVLPGYQFLLWIALTQRRLNWARAVLGLSIPWSLKYYRTNLYQKGMWGYGKSEDLGTERRGLRFPALFFAVCISDLPAVNLSPFTCTLGAVRRGTDLAQSRHCQADRTLWDATRFKNEIMLKKVLWKLYVNVGTFNNTITRGLLLHLVYMWVMQWVSKSGGSKTGFLRHVLLNQAHVCPLVSDSSSCKLSNRGRSKDCALCVCVCV